ncbi:SCO family protein [Hymenobacter glacieicola]|uniref:Photosynthetic protein synthase II n=1 Tax=Hymenobacter glacieicola TaxID=1562124 RepID=A0ABQ1X172_9BACT|nr:SCO family protein [Hymenobacter glacieicola]GGG54774.1 photosynthetic protein synthase II [Hymenobacter glacieicola]
MNTSFLRSAGHLLLASVLFSATAALPACTTNPEADKPERLSIIGIKHSAPRTPADTLPDPVPSFRLTNQEGKTITNQTFAGKVYITDFFFATCPSICPKMQSEMLRVYKQFEGNPNVLFLSHTIDPAHDSIPVLRDYAERLGIKDASRWHFATAPHDTVFALAHAYMASAQVDKKVAGGFAHSGAFALIDSHRRIRGVYDGMEKSEVDRLIQELPLLLKEEQEEQKVATR